MRLGEYRIIRLGRFRVNADRIFVIFEKGSFENSPSLMADPGMYNKTGFLKRCAIIIGRGILSPPTKKIHIFALLECLKIWYEYLSCPYI